MNLRRGRFIILPLVALASILADQISKQLIRSTLSPGESVRLAPGLDAIFQFTYVTNSGAAFGLFPGSSYLFVVVAIFVIVALIWYYLRLSTGQWLVQVALGLQLAGATGNLIDRLRFSGSVTDFIDLNFWPLRRWPVFNLADASIVTGVVILTLVMIWEEWREERSEGQLIPAVDE